MSAHRAEGGWLAGGQTGAWASLVSVGSPLPGPAPPCWALHLSDSRAGGQELGEVGQESLEGLFYFQRIQAQGPPPPGSEGHVLSLSSIQWSQLPPQLPCLMVIGGGNVVFAFLAS